MSKDNSHPYVRNVRFEILRFELNDPTSVDKLKKTSPACILGAILHDDTASPREQRNASKNIATMCPTLTKSTQKKPRVFHSSSWGYLFDEGNTVRNARWADGGDGLFCPMLLVG